ncbi:hypothetical protein DXG01_009318 [Tephrocybe rancida]|nr:hypothetical protein DXG01_009318 [Tephrocybe rancida]
MDSMRETIQAKLSKSIQSQLGKKIMSAFEDWTTVPKLSGGKRRSAYFEPESDTWSPSNNNNIEVEQGLPPTPTSSLLFCTQTDPSLPPLASRSGPSQLPLLPPSPPPSPPPPFSPVPSSQPRVPAEPLLSSLPASRSASHRKCRPQLSEYTRAAVVVESSGGSGPAQNVQTDSESDLPLFVVPSFSEPCPENVPSQFVPSQERGVETCPPTTSQFDVPNLPATTPLEPFGVLTTASPTPPNTRLSEE